MWITFLLSLAGTIIGFPFGWLITKYLVDRSDAKKQRALRAATLRAPRDKRVM